MALALKISKTKRGRTTDEFVSEQLERWKHYKELYVAEEALKRAERELDEVMRYELDHLDELYSNFPRGV